MSEYNSQRYSVALLDDGSENVEQVLAREDRSDVARALFELMRAQYPDRVIVLCAGEMVLDRSDR